MKPHLQKYRGYSIRKIYERGYSVMRPGGAHLKTAPDFSSAIVVVDMDIQLQRALEASCECA